ncbi:MAG: 16S rRNA (guanine(966)-N(2))-methyltransferase RsmD [Synechococcaceae cyanobacterium]|nr:16S rRNA (guanine(966)-N(2))-methyltransferase RsmD [Synechococcaceae cyanobacterium]
MSLRLSGGRKLQSPPGSTARPTPARVRQAVMNMLSAELPGCSWLDLCCGSGVMACEALQRGARRVVAVDQDRRMAATARSNLTLVAAGQTPPPQITVVQQDVLRWLGQAAAASGGAGDAGRADRATAFDLIYADPPYASGLYARLCEGIAAGHWLKDGGLLLLECASAEPPSLPEGWTVLKERHYGTSTILMLTRTTASAQEGPH